MPETLTELLRRQRRDFEAAGVESPALSAELLLAEALGLDRSALLHNLILEPSATIIDIANQDASKQNVPWQDAREKFLALCARRLQGEPVAYILGRKEFYGREFLVNRHTLIPRPETELIVDCALDWAKKRTTETKNQLNAAIGQKTHLACFADLGTGSGCLAVTLALELPGWRGLALDISDQALNMARENVSRLGVSKNLEFVLADFTRFEFAENSLDLLVSNPPYVSADEYAGLEKGVREFEPHSALVPQGNMNGSAPSGTELLAPLCALAARALKPGGLFLMEIGCGQGDYLRSLLARDPAWSETDVLPDLAGLDRLVRAVAR
ncbi:MAG: peptide chain release factor N(5)-glutamine methyltransferase [Deltaproteobacteria bacterium]|jgi:release factor glutamine methyltransferase|nr:peptide chain release factor N(5)-glutamine methyltransferase [Deltaproteobacteria bacterium]